MEDPKAWWEERLSASTGALGELGVREPNAGHHALAELEKKVLLKLYGMVTYFLPKKYLELYFL